MKPQVAHLGMLVEMTHPTRGSVRLVGSGIQMSQSPPEMRLPPPTLGENNEEILNGLGYRAEAIAKFRQKGVI